MSARDLRPSSRAFETGLRNLSTRLTNLERRSRWSGATQFTEDAGPTSMTYVTQYPATNPLTWDEILTITLDPGRWLIQGGLSIDSKTESGLLWWSRSRFTIDAVVQDLGQPVAQGEAGSLDTDAVDPLYGVMTAVLDEQKTVKLEASWATDSSVSFTVSAINAYLIAVPA